MTTIWTRPRKGEGGGETAIIQNEPKFKAEFSTLNLRPKINELIPQNLYLIATRKNNYKVEYGQLPTDDGYLYLDELEQKLYYSELTYDNPQFLCNWDQELAGGLTCQNFNPTITNDGDIIFFRRPQGSLTRHNPIIYPASDYNNPKIIDFEEGIKPFGFQRDVNVEHHFKNDYFMFGEYRTWGGQADNGKEIYVWKVTKPYDNPDSWRRVLILHVLDWQDASNGTGDYPNTEIGHFHTCQYDFYSDAWLASTGDVRHQNRILISKDEGENWEDLNLGGGQTVRLTGFIFMKDFVWYQTDDAGVHHLYKVPRDAEGYPDFVNRIKVSDLTPRQAGYLTLYLRYPEGLLMIDRAEPRHDHKYDLQFYSFEYEKLYNVGTFDRIDNGDKYEGDGRHGLPVFTSTHYQSIYEDGIILGGNSLTKPFTVKVLGNNDGNIMGVLKVKIVKN